jgi:hypothetical protein
MHERKQADSASGHEGQCRQSLKRSLDSRWKVFAALGGGALVLSLYAMWKTLLYFNASGDTAGSAIFACIALCLLLVTGLQWYMAAGFKMGRLDLVTSSLAAATLLRGNRIVMETTRVQFLRKLDTDDVSLTPNDRYVFFICAFRPWVCKEAQFQVT